MITLADGRRFAISSIEAEIPRFGNWFFDIIPIFTNEDKEIKPNGKIQIAAFGRVFSGTIISGNEKKLRVVGGNGGLQKIVSPIAYEYVQRGEPIKRAIMEAGEILSPTSNAGVLSTVLEKAAIASMPLSELLSVLLPSDAKWQMTFDGKIKIMKPSEEKAPMWVPNEPVTILEEDAANSVFILGSSELTMLPGMLVNGMMTSHVSLKLSGGAGRAIIRTQTAESPLSNVSEMVRAILNILSPKLKYLKSYKARVLEMTAGNVSVEILNDKTIPEMTNVPIMGVPGLYVEVSPGALCHVSFSDGDFRRPFAHNFEASHLSSIEVRASGQISLGEGAASKVVRVGDIAVGAVPGCYVMSSTGPLPVLPYPKAGITGLDPPAGIPIAVALTSGSSKVKVK